MLYGLHHFYTDHDMWMCTPITPLVMYDYVVVYVDDLFTSMVDPATFFQALQSPPWKYMLKGVGEPHYHLGADFFQDNNHTLCMGTQTYIKCLLANNKKLFGDLPHPVFSALADNDCPELDTTLLCGPNDITKYQSLIVACQLLISLVQFDLDQPFMSLSCFHHCPSQGHINQVKHLCVYIRRFPHGAIHFHTGCLSHEDYYSSHLAYYTWQDTIYEPIHEDLPMNAPPPHSWPITTLVPSMST